MVVVHRVWAVGLWCCCGAVALAQEGPATIEAARNAAPQESAGAPTSVPAFRSGVDLVSLTVTVTDRERKFLSDLTADDFCIFEDGVRQPLSFFAAESVPLDLAILVDGSASMRENMSIVTPAAVGLARTLRPQDRATVIEFRDDVRVRQELTNNVASIERAIASIHPSGGTALYNAISVALEALRHAAGDDRSVRRQALVTISDGEDTTSLIDYDDVLDRARRSGVTLYLIALRSQLAAFRDSTGANGRFPGQSEFAMRNLAEQTGGQAFFPTAVGQLPPIYASIADELGHQYALGYQPQNQRRDGAWRNVLVQVPTRPGVRPRTRPGYFAATGPRDLLSTLRAIVTRGQP